MLSSLHSLPNVFQSARSYPNPSSSGSEPRPSSSGQKRASEQESGYGSALSLVKDEEGTRVSNSV